MEQAPQRIELPIKNFKAQDNIFKCKTRNKIVVKGRRFGLTRGVANDFIQCALQGKFKQGLWVDVINSNIEKYVERYFIPHLKKLPDNLWRWRVQQKILTIRDAYIDFRSADRPESIEGFGYDKYFLNEAGIILKNEYLWYNAIKPMLFEYKPQGVIGGTPKKGMGKLFRELAMQAQDPDNKDYKYFHYTTFDNPYLSKVEIEKEMKLMPERVIRQEIYADFIDDDGVVFKGVKDIMTATPQRAQIGHLYEMGVDLGKVQDWTVIAVYDRVTNQQVFQDRFQQFDWSFQKQKIKSIAQMYNNALIRVDATGLGDPIADDLIRAGLSVEPFKFTNESKKELVEKMSTWVDLGRIRMINMEETYNEFNAFTYDVSESGKMVYSAPEGLHDDIVFAHCLAVWGLSAPVVVASKPQQPLIREEFQRRIKISYGTDENDNDYEPI